MTQPPEQPDEQRTLVEPRSLPDFAESPSGTDRAAQRAAAGEAIPLSRLADYELVGEIGRGGMGVVYKARHVKLGRVVALKMILGGTLARKDDLQRFEMEARAAAQLHHPGIVAVFDVGCQDDQPYFSMELITGTSLAQKTTLGPVPGRDAAAYLEATARAVHFAHQRGVLHRDLKPANILVDEEDRPRITDFGLAKVLTTDSGQTRTGAVLGTPSYMSPEQAQGRKDIGPAGDVYSLGAILYELLTGRPPFRGETALATLSLVANQDPVAPRLLNPGVDRDLETICLKCLEKDPKRRYASAEALADDLALYLQGEPIAARRLGLVGRGLKWCRRKPAQATLLAVSTLAILFFIGFQYHTTQQERELREEAEHAREQAALREKTMAYFLYHAHMRRGQQSLENADWDRAEAILATWETPKPGLSDLRDWEWFFLKARCEGPSLLGTHPGPGTAVAYRPDGKQVASAGGEPLKAGEIKLWNTRSGELLHTLHGHANRITSLAYNGAANGTATLLASGAFDRTVRVWSLETAAELWTLKHGKAVKAVCFSPDGRWLASAGEDGLVLLWDVQALHDGKREPSFTLKAHSGEASCVSFSPDAALLATGGADGLVKLWNLPDGTPHKTFKGHSGEVRCLAFSPQGKVLASGGGRGGRQGEVRIWDVEKGALRFSRFGLSESILSLAFGNSGRLAAAGKDGVIRVWENAISSEALTFRGDSQLVYGIALSPDGLSIACAGHSGRVSIHNTSGGLETLVLPMEGRVETLAFNPAARFLAAAGKGDHIAVWNLDYPEKPIKLPVDVNVHALAFAPDGTFLAAGCADHHIRLFDLREPDKDPVLLKGHGAAVRTLAFRRDGLQLASASDGEEVIHLWDPRTGKITASLTGHENSILSITYSADGRLLASGGYDKTIRIWDVQTGAVLMKREGHRGSVNGLAFNNDGSVLASVSSDHTLRLWDPLGTADPRVLEGSPGQVFSVAYHPQGRRIATIGQDKTIRLWDAVARQEILELETPTGDLRQVAFSPDGRFLAVAGQGAVRVWDARRKFAP